ncbi:MAG: PAS domain S-box protein, partial [Pseudomonadota bacterium]|nr:PAS domain S-box protein [Pseudomonadota bacterium]
MANPHQPVTANGQRSYGNRAWRIAAGYTVFAACWILLSDYLLARLIPDPETLVRIGVYKGIVFVAVTAGLLLLVLRRVFGALERNYEALKSQEEVARSERRFSDTMIESMPGVLYFYNEQGKFLRWNRNFETASGYTGAEIARMHPLQFFPPAEQPRVAERIAEVFSRGISSVEAPFRARDGRTTPYYLTGCRVTFQDQPCLVGVGIDISERRETELALERSERRHRTTLDSILEGCQIIDFDWRYLYLNDTAARHNRRPNAGLLGRRMPDEWPGIENSRIYELIEQGITARAIAQEEVHFKYPDGNHGWFDVRVQPVLEGVLVLSQEITERRQAEQALRGLNKTLEGQVAERTAELQTALVRAEESDRMKSAFLATMSHELRTPLNSILGFTGILLRQLAGPLDPEQIKQLGMVQSSSRHLLELINDVLDLSKIEAGHLPVSAMEFDPRESVERVAAMMGPIADKKSLSLKVELPERLPRMISDRRRVEQVLLNLLNNAVKFTNRGGVRLLVQTIDDYRRRPDSAAVPALHLRVIDTGIGIRSEDFPSLFLPFRQLDSGLTRQHEGTGLGLAICPR